MSGLFVSHSGANNAEAVAIVDWLAEEGWENVFLDLHPERGIKAGQRWDEALDQAGSRCEAVIFLISRGWLASYEKSDYCREEFDYARHLNKTLIGAIVEKDIEIDELPERLKRVQVFSLAAGQDHRTFHVILPITHREADVSFSREGLVRLRAALREAGVDPPFLAWPPADDPYRPPYRGA
jgi:hypothetical protein